MLEQSSGLIAKYYTGIGSRETPQEVEPIIEEICIFMDKLGFILRSGGAPGADSMFEKYTNKKDIYLPWKGFNNNTSELYLDNISEYEVHKSLEISCKYHPNWRALSNAGKKLMTRNVFQIYGREGEGISKLVICWTKGGTINSGTGQAMRIAKALDIPIFNLYHKESLHQIKIYINSLC